VNDDDEKGNERGRTGKKRDSRAMRLRSILESGE
jgi:hypothetical protein